MTATRVIRSISVLNADDVCDDGNLTFGDGFSWFCTLKNESRGGGGYAASRDSESGGPLPSMLGLFLPLAGRRRLRQPRPHARGLLFLATVGVCLSAGVAHAQVDCSATGTTGVPQIECEALMALYISADGTNWTDNSNWDTASAVSTWFGVAVLGGQVTGLSLVTNQLTGTIPPELGNLTNLTDLRLYSNQLTGAIPPELGNLTNLRILNLHLNQLTGAIPPELGNLSNVTDLRVHDNRLTGAIPPELGNLANLITAYLFNNQLSGPIPPELSNLANVATLHLSNNQLTGSIPPELGNLANLIGLYLGSNQLTCPSPPELGNRSTLTTLHLAGNQLSGPIPPELGNLSNLTALYLYGNQLTGSIPPWIGNLTNLTTIYLSSNQLTGPIPSELGNLTNLVSLFLFGNQLSGSLPPELGDLTNLTTLYLTGNQLTGPIPPELGNLSNLGTLFLTGNQLTGPIPPELGNLSSLTTLQLSSNQLAGDFPDLTALPLTSLNFGNNAFVFADFETEFFAYNDGAPATFSYGPQATVDTARTENFTSGAPAILPSAVAANPSGNDQYQWYKDGAPIAGPYGTSRDLDVTLGGGSVASANAGNYRYTISNAVVTGLTLTSQVITLTVSATCGDGFVNDPSEVCDDGNLSTGDGCNAACLLEVGEPCTGDTDCATNLCNMAAMPAVCAPPVGCGNGLLEAGEACDDGNNMNGDGCTAACEIEDGNPCTTHAACASGVCDMNEAPPLCEPAGSCGNGVLDGSESCDDGNLMTGDGCSNICLLEDGEPCADNAQCESTICDTVDSNTCEPVNTCGNGAVEVGEGCDDGNAVAGDGCGPECLFELGAGPCTDNGQCESTICDALGGNTCEPVNTCGNGTIETAEMCDDGNTAPGDSCDPQCLLELGAGPCTDGNQCGSGVCNKLAAIPVCAVPLGCGNGVLNDDEACDDGNLLRGDGCGESCSLENGWRGGGGCAVSSGTENGGRGWLLGLLIAGLARWRRLRPTRKG
ncbi:MAG: leucine-rich repeat domain-containing protein [Polyangiales bacterium]